MNALLVVGGALAGAPARYLLDGWVKGRRPGPFPAGILVVNVLGSLLLGLLVAAAGTSTGTPWWFVLLGIGFCGAFTTFSTFSYDVVRLIEDRAAALALVTVLAQLVLCFIAAVLGWWVGDLLVH